MAGMACVFAASIMKNFLSDAPAIFPASIHLHGLIRTLPKNEASFFMSLHIRFSCHVSEVAQSALNIMVKCRVETETSAITLKLVKTNYHRWRSFLIDQYVFQSCAINE